VGNTLVDVIISAIGKLQICGNCKGFGKSALFHTHSILNVGNPGYGSDFYEQSKYGKYDCYEELNVKLNISAVSLNTCFKHIVLHVEDLKVASHRISKVKKYDQGAEV
jgi:hypothetical protein